jgi:hypothetical protein
MMRPCVKRRQSTSVYIGNTLGVQGPTNAETRFKQALQKGHILLTITEGRIIWLTKRNC